MPKTKSKGQTKPRGASVPGRKSTRQVQPQAASRSAGRSKLRELPLRGPNAVGKSVRAQAERYHRGDTQRRFDVARGKRLGTNAAESRAGRGMPDMGQALKQKARNQGRRPKKVAASTRKPRSRLGRQPVRR